MYLFWGQKVKGQGQEAQKHCRHGSWRFCECWLLFVVSGSILQCSVKATRKLFN